MVSGPDFCIIPVTSLHNSLLFLKVNNNLLFYFPRSAITNYFKLDGLKEQKFILSVMEV